MVLRHAAWRAARLHRNTALSRTSAFQALAPASAHSVLAFGSGVSERRFSSASGASPLEETTTTLLFADGQLTGTYEQMRS